jgi:4-amino-4-deoxy-L-arabinose transferase-like glycosyltransferase
MSWKPFVGRWWLDVVLVGALTAFAVWQLWCPPKWAVNNMQEAQKFTVGAWYLYKTGRYEWIINHRAYPVENGIGYGLLLVPSFWLFGDFLGNAIYSQLALAVLACLGVYAVLRICFGPWQGFIAGLVLASYPIFTEYSRMNDTCIAQVFFLAVGLLLFLRMTVDERWPSLVRWSLWGLCAGWAATIRPDNVVIFGLLTAALWWRAEPRLTNVVKQLGVATLGAFSPLAYMFWYNQHYCGSWLRDPRCVWHSMPWGSGWRVFDIHMALGHSKYVSGNADGGNLLFYGREILGQFADWPSWSDQQKLMLMVPCFCLAQCMIVGIGYAWWQRRNSESKRRFLVYTTITTGATFLLYIFLPVHATRYVVPLAPCAASFVGVGAIGLMRAAWRRSRTWTVCALVALLLPAGQWLGSTQVAIRQGDMLPVSFLLQQTAAAIENNAVIISTAGPFLTDFYVVRDTQRMFVPLDHRTTWRIQPRPPKNQAIIPPFESPDGTYPGDLENGAVDIFEFSAIENPERIEKLLRQGAPVYFFDHTYGNWCDQLPLLSQHFGMQPVLGYTPKEPLSHFSQPGVCLWRLLPRQS